MNIQISKSVTAYQAADHQNGPDTWVLVENRIELGEVPATSVLCAALDQLALYQEFFALTNEITKLVGDSHVNIETICGTRNALQKVVKTINALNEGASLKSDWSNKL